MRLAVAASLSLFACSTATVLEHADSGVDPPSASDAATDATPPDDAGLVVCPGQPTAETSVATLGRCDAGYVYGVFGINGGLCPIGDAGSCVLIMNNPNARYAEVCCEQAACVRFTAPLDEQCGFEFDAGDGGKFTGWSCAPKAVPPGKCKLRGGNEYCCQP